MVTRRHFLQQAALVAGTTCAPSLIRSVAAQQTQSAAPFQDAHVISGTARERGRSYGRQFADGIHEFLDREILTAFVGKPSMKEEMDRYAGGCWKVIQSECPIIADELEGM